MMPPPLHVCVSFASTGLTSIRIFCRILFPCPWYNFTQNIISSSVLGIDYFLQMSSKSVHPVFVQSERNADVDTYGTSGQRENCLRLVEPKWTIKLTTITNNRRAFDTEAYSLLRASFLLLILLTDPTAVIQWSAEARHLFACTVIDVVPSIATASLYTSCMKSLHCRHNGS